MMDEDRYKKILRTCMVDEEKGRMRIRTKVCVASVVVIVCIAIGTITAHFVEDLNWANSFYLSVTSLQCLQKRSREMTKWILQKKITLTDLAAADLDHDGSISKSDFVIYKLKQMGKITEIDILQISKQFDSLDHAMYGKITLADLMETV
ncbi:hypothetical protein TSUD_253460 [Trifolium subterraneum]|nr:hypothetical protein TSUD_253460 [Trifolium subterraneum]